LASPTRARLPFVSSTFPMMKQSTACGVVCETSSWSRPLPACPRSSSQVLKEHFGDHLTDKLRSQLFLAHHHVFVGKFTKSPRPRAPRQRHVALLLRTVDAGCATLAVERNASLRECQRELCKLFKKAFPKHKASLVFTGARVYDDFMDRPFRRCAPTDEAVVVFTETDDPYFYDVFDRRGKLPLAGDEEGLSLLRI
jgi:hypothetical protein